MIGRNDHELRAPESAMLAAKMVDFLAAGGVVDEVAPRVGAPAPTFFNNHAPTVKSSPKRVGRSREVSAVREQQIQRARDAAKTMSITDAASALGISRDTLRRMAESHGFAFQKADSYIDRTKDAADVERIKAAIAVGLSRNTVITQMSISYNRLHRLIDEHGLDFPRQKAFKK